jgi:hypothetical protein
MMPSRVSFLLLMGAGFSCLALAGLIYLNSGQEPVALVVDEPHRVLNDLAPGASRDIEFRIKNQSGRPLRIVGTSAL